MEEGEGRSETGNIKAFLPLRRAVTCAGLRSFAGRSRWAWGCGEDLKMRRIACNIRGGGASASYPGGFATLSRQAACQGSRGLRSAGQPRAGGQEKGPPSHWEQLV